MSSQADKKTWTTLQEESAEGHEGGISHVRSVSGRFQSLQDIAYNELRDNILNGTLKSGESLNTSELSRVMKISRTPIREAINRLCTLGLVDKQDHVEARVATFQTKEIYEFYYVRNALEGLAAKNAANFLPIKDRLRLRALSDQMQAYAGADDTGSYLRVNHEFHTLIYSTVKTPMIVALLEQVLAITVRYRAFAHVLAQNGSWMVEEHRNMAESILAGDGDEAEKWSIEHNTVHLRLLEKIMYSDNDSTDWNAFLE